MNWILSEDLKAAEIASTCIILELAWWTSNGLLELIPFFTGIFLSYDTSLVSIFSKKKQTNVSF